MDKQKDKSNFKVTDKRLFDEEGEVREHRIKKDNNKWAENNDIYAILV